MIKIEKVIKRDWTFYGFRVTTEEFLDKNNDATFFKNKKYYKYHNSVSCAEILDFKFGIEKRWLWNGVLVE